MAGRKIFKNPGKKTLPLALLSCSLLLLGGITFYNNGILSVSPVKKYDLWRPFYKALQQSDMTMPTIELTVRLAATKEMIGRLFCEMLRSATLFWNPAYGPVHLILDDADRTNMEMSEAYLNALGLPFTFRVSYEKRPRNLTEFDRAANHAGRPFGYMQQLHSSYLMDLYTNAPVIAWSDADAVFLTVVTKERIMKNGKLIVKGMNTFSELSWVYEWDEDTRAQLGLPMVSDFMIYFPVYLYADTIKSCREFITKRFQKSNFEDAFIASIFKGSRTSPSPVSVLLSYAFYFERSRYEWHLDIGDASLEEYNKRFPVREYHVLPIHTLMEPHVSLHTKGGYHKILEYGICRLHLILGTNATGCAKLIDDDDKMLWYYLGFDPYRNHVPTWCGGKKRAACLLLLKKHEANIWKTVKNDNHSIDSRLMFLVEQVARQKYGATCETVNHIPIVH